MSRDDRRALSPEAQLVYGCASLTMPATEARALTERPLDWPRVLHLAEREVAVASLGRLLHAAGVKAVPIEAAEYLRRSGMVNDFRMRFLSDRLRETVERLREAEVPILLLKGAAVGAMVDATFTTRPMTDIDVLVRPDHVARARTAILAAGWEATTDLVLIELLRTHHHLPPFVETRLPGVRLELHVGLLAPDHSFDFGEEAVWRDAQPSGAPFVGASVPLPEHLLLHACLHFAWQHSMRFGAWRTFRLVSAVAANARFDWDRFVKHAHRAKGATACYWTLRLAGRMAGCPVPDSVLARLAAPTPEWVSAAIERHFIAGIVPGEGAACPSEWLTRMLWRAALRPRWSRHATAGRWDPERRWERALGVVVDESVAARTSRHLSGYRDWFSFLFRTLLP